LLRCAAARSGLVLQVRESAAERSLTLVESFDLVFDRRDLLGPSGRPLGEDALLLGDVPAFLLRSFDGRPKRGALAVEVHDLFSRAGRLFSRACGAGPGLLRGSRLLFGDLAIGLGFLCRAPRFLDDLGSRRFPVRRADGQIREVTRAFLGEPCQSGEALAERGKAVFRSERLLRLAGRARGGLLELFGSGAQTSDLAGQLLDLPGEPPLGLDVGFADDREVVGDPDRQPNTGQLGGDLAGSLRQLGLPLEGANLAAKLPDQVADTLDVGVDPLELAKRALLAAPVLEDAGRFLDVRASLLGAGVQDLVELTLADDRMQLTAHTRVGEQLLNIEKPARHAVHGVLALTGPEESPADRHFAELDRKDARGVVDRERDLGAS
jgi:hypothetical protein